MTISNICVFFDTEEPVKIPYLDSLKDLSTRILTAESKKGAVNIVFTNDPPVRALNKEYRGLDKTTDVLSFEWNEPDILGEIYISVDQVKKQAPEYDNTFYQEMKRVLVHGVLHLCGYDHLTVKERKIMRNSEEHYLSKKIY
ncbi:MAG: rRNA maturation RNase YbeY [Fibrobacterales bacterium]